MRLEHFISAHPLMDSDTWRQELVRGEVVPVTQRPPAVTARSIEVLTALTGAVRRAKGGPFGIISGSGVGRESEEGDDFRLADVLVQAPVSKTGKRKETVLIANVLNDVDAHDDAVDDRIAVYKSQKHIKEILIFDAERPVCIAHRLVGGSWSSERIEGTGATMRLRTLAVTLMMLSVYSGEQVTDT